MLCLTRAIGETIEVSGPATFKLLSVKGGRARIGIDAPDSTDIVRGELHDRDKDDDEQLFATAHFDCPKPRVDHAECD